MLFIGPHDAVPNAPPFFPPPPPLSFHPFRSLPYVCQATRYRCRASFLLLFHSYYTTTTTTTPNNQYAMAIRALHTHTHTLCISARLFASHSSFFFQLGRPSFLLLFNQISGELLRKTHNPPTLFFRRLSFLFFFLNKNAYF